MHWTFTSCSLLLLFNLFGTDAAFSSVSGIITHKSSTICQKLKASFSRLSTTNYDAEKIDNACNDYSNSLWSFRELGYSKCRYHVGPILMSFYSTDMSKQASVWNCQDPSLNNIFGGAVRHYDESPPLDSEIAPGSVLYDPLANSLPASVSGISTLIDEPIEVPKAVVLKEGTIDVLKMENLKTIPVSINSIGMECELSGSLVSLVQRKADSDEFTSSDMNGKLEYSQVLFRTTLSIGAVPLLSFTLDGSKAVEIFDLYFGETLLPQNVLDRFNILWRDEIRRTGDLNFLEYESRDIPKDKLNELVINDEEGYSGDDVVNTYSVGKGTKDDDGYFRLIEIISGPVKADDESGLNIRKVQRAIQMLLNEFKPFFTSDKKFSPLCDQTLTHFEISSYGIITEKKKKMAKLQTIIDSYNSKLDVELNDFKLVLNPFFNSEVIDGVKRYNSEDLMQTHEYMLMCNTFSYTADSVCQYLHMQMDGPHHSIQYKKKYILQMYDYSETTAKNLMSYVFELSAAKLNVNDRLELTGFFSLLNLESYFDTLTNFNKIFCECRKYLSLANDAATQKNRIPFLPKLDVEDVKMNMPMQFEIISALYNSNVDKFLEEYLDIDKFNLVAVAYSPLFGKDPIAFNCYRSTFGFFIRRYLNQLFSVTPVIKSAPISFVAKTIPVMVEKLPSTDDGLDQIRIHTVVESRIFLDQFNKNFIPIPTGNFNIGASVTSESLRKLRDLWKFPQFDCVAPGCILPVIKPPTVPSQLRDSNLKPYIESAIGVGDEFVFPCPRNLPPAPVSLYGGDPVLPNPDISDHHFSEIKAVVNNKQKSSKHSSNATLHEVVSKVKRKVPQNKKVVSLKGSKRNQ